LKFEIDESTPAGIANSSGAMCTRRANRAGFAADAVQSAVIATDAGSAAGQRGKTCIRIDVKRDAFDECRTISFTSDALNRMFTNSLNTSNGECRSRLASVVIPTYRFSLSALASSSFVQPPGQTW